MNRQDWKTAYGHARQLAKGKDGLLTVGAEFFTMLQGVPHGRVLHPSIIRDRSVSSRVAEALFWARQYRLSASKRGKAGTYFAFHAAHDKEGARACIQEARAICGAKSAFQTIPA